MNIDITKKYTTLSGKPVRIYATDGGGTFPIHGSYWDEDSWVITRWTPDGCFFSSGCDEWRNLIPVKTWRAWEGGKAPVHIMLRQKGFSLVETKHTKHCNLSMLFLNYIRVHEDGTETPCGVES